MATSLVEGKLKVQILKMLKIYFMSHPAHAVGLVNIYSSKEVF